MGKKVDILLSTYNGEKYVESQIDSILCQTYSNFHLFIRDDGSQDKTNDVLKKYEDNPKVTIVRGKNLGFVKSFFTLLGMDDSADYYSFADQDDIWLKDKVWFAVEKLEEKNTEKPCLYFSNYDYYDGEMNFKGHCVTCKRKPTFQNALVDNVAVGCCSVINQSARRSILTHQPEHCCVHDWWMYLLCNAIGEVIYDTRYTIKYRRHETNATPCGKNGIQLLLWRIKKFFKQDYFSKVRDQLAEFGMLYQDELTEHKKNLLALFTNRRYHIGTALEKTFYPTRFRQRFVDEIMIRFIFLIGKL